MSDFDIRPLDGSPQIRQALSEILVEVVANGGSVSFMHPLAVEEADAFWEGSLAAAARGERVVLGAFDGETLVATLTLILKFPPNQPHRAELAKMMTRLSHRGRGAARSLVLAAQQLAQQHGKTHLMLDTAADEGAAGFYERLGFERAGVVPDFALKPHGGLSATIFYWKRLGVEL